MLKPVLAVFRRSSRRRAPAIANTRLPRTCIRGGLWVSRLKKSVDKQHLRHPGPKADAHTALHAISPTRAASRPYTVCFFAVSHQHHRQSRNITEQSWTLEKVETLVRVPKLDPDFAPLIGHRTLRLLDDSFQPVPRIHSSVCTTTTQPPTSSARDGTTLVFHQFSPRSLDGSTIPFDTPTSPAGL